MATAEEYAGWIVANQDKRGTPEFETVAQAYKTVRGQVQEAKPTEAEKAAGNPLTRFAIGAAKPVLGAVQLAVNAVPNPYRGMPQDGRPTSIGEDVNEHLARLEDMTQKGRGKNAGFDFADAAGQVLSPVNALAANKIEMAGNVGKLALKGGAVGAGGAVLNPITNRDEQKDFWTNKAKDAAVGFGTGGVLTPFASKLGDAIVRRLPQDSQVVGARASLETDSILSKALADVGQKIEDIPKQQYADLRKQVVDALKDGKKLDAGALLRKQDFAEAGLPALQGQITRDASQFARERNLRGVANAGEPLLTTMETQNRGLQSGIGQFAQGASDHVTAGERLAQALSQVDEGLKGNVKSAYDLARDHVGRAAPMNAAEFSKSANLALDDGMLGHYLPAQVRNVMNDVSAGKIPFNVNTAVQIDSTLSAAQRAAGHGTPEALAIGKVRDALNKTGISDNVGEDAKRAFDAARGLARDRFALHEANPALEAASQGTHGAVPADAYIRKFVTNAPTEQVKRLADMLRRESPEAFNEARSQIGKQLERAAFGENVAGDKIFAPERYAKALREIGDGKLGAFFEKGQIEQLKRMGRVGAYINSTPSAAPVNTSNTAQAMMTLLGRVTGMHAAGAVANAAVAPILNQRAVAKSMAAAVPSTKAPLSPEQKKLLARMLTVGGASGGALSTQ